MVPAKAHGPTVFDLNSVGVAAIYGRQAQEEWHLFTDMPLAAPN